MKLLRLVTLRSLSTRWLRSILTLFGIILGVAAMFSINSVNQNAYDSITRLFEGTSGKVALEVHSAANVGGFSEEILTSVNNTQGVLQAVPVIMLPASFPQETPEEVSLDFFGMDSGGIILYGIDPQEDLKVRDYTISQGVFLEDASSEIQIVLVEDYALELDIQIGQEINIITANGPAQVKVVGLIKKDGAGLMNMGKFGVIHWEAAQKLLEREGEIDRIDIITQAKEKNTEFLETLKETLGQSLGEDYTAAYPANQGEQMSQMLTGYQLSLNFMAGIALFVGAFLIYNALSMTVAERSRELALLRCVGMTRRQITFQVIFEGFVLGIVGALLGVGAGILMSLGLTSFMSQVLGQELKYGSLSYDIMFSSMAVGIGVTLLSAFFPAYQAGKISPIAALQIRGEKKKDGCKSTDGLLDFYYSLFLRQFLFGIPLPMMCSLG